MLYSYISAIIANMKFFLYKYKCFAAEQTISQHIIKDLVKIVNLEKKKYRKNKKLTLL